MQDASGAVYCPTSFPMPNAMGSSFNASMVQTMGFVIGLELRALWRVGDTEASSWSGRPPAGPNTWSPTINNPRDPRWGRYQEVPSESPLWLGRFAQMYTLGAQWGQAAPALRVAAGLAPTPTERDQQYIVTVTTIKHYAAYSLEDSDGVQRYNFDATVAPFDLVDSYLPHFRLAMAGPQGALGIMCALAFLGLMGLDDCEQIGSDSCKLADRLVQCHQWRADMRGWQLERASHLPARDLQQHCLHDL